MGMKRFTLKAPDGQDNVTIDVVIDNNNVARTNIPFCGWWGRLKSDDIWPFVLLSDGRLDFGSNSEEDQTDRYGRMKIHGQTLDSGTVISLEYDKREVILRVDKAIDLLDLG